MRKVILVVFSPRLKVWRTHEKACPRKISTAEVHINSSKYQTVCELLTPCRFIHAFIFKRKRGRDLNIISAGSGLISGVGGQCLWAGAKQKCSWLHGTAGTPLTSPVCSLHLPMGQSVGVWSGGVG